MKKILPHCLLIGSILAFACQAADQTSQALSLDNKEVHSLQESLKNNVMAPCPPQWEELVDKRQYAYQCVDQLDGSGDIFKQSDKDFGLFSPMITVSDMFRSPPPFTTVWKTSVTEEGTPVMSRLYADVLFAKEQHIDRGDYVIHYYYRISRTFRLRPGN